MDALEKREEMDRLHQRVSDLRERVVLLEAQNPHINSALVRIQVSVDRLNGHLVRAIWAVFLLFLGVVFKFTIDGGFTIPIPV